MGNHARTERLSQESDGGEKSLCDLFHKASDVARATLNAMQEIAGTTSCKGVQIASLKKWAHQENGEHDIFDALPNNVLHGLDDNLYFIDTIIYKSSEETINTYKSQSPRFNADK